MTTRRRILMGTLLVLVAGAVVAFVGVGAPAALRWWHCEGNAPSGGQPAWSPDGQLIAFRRGTGIWTVHPDGTDPIQVTRSACDGDAHPSWAPDGRRLVFGHGSRVWIANADGSARRVLAAGQDPAWSPDGNWITFVTGGGDLYVVRPDGTRRHKISTGDDTAFGASWGPDSRRIVFAGHGALYVVSRNTSGVEDAWFPALDHVGVGDAAWSPDGSRITFSAPDGIEVVTPTTGKTRTIVHEADAYDPSWSPDGKRIAFYAFGGGIFVVNRDGSGLRKVTGA